EGRPVPVDDRTVDKICTVHSQREGAAAGSSTGGGERADRRCWVVNRECRWARSAAARRGVSDGDVGRARAGNVGGRHLRADLGGTDEAGREGRAVPVDDRTVDKICTVDGQREGGASDGGSGW